ncbi:MAG: DUF1800 family protein [Bacteroidota bacterium]
MQNKVFTLSTTFLFLFYFSSYLTAQVYEDYIGGGHSQGIEVVTSNDFSPNDWDEVASGGQSINGSGLDARLFETARFLSQATLGANRDYIESVAEMDYEDWLDGQFQIPTTSMFQETDSAFNVALDLYVQNGGDPEDYFGPYLPHFYYGLWRHNLMNEDLLRQRVAHALSEILVISLQSELGDFGYGLASYWDILQENAFGNYEDLLMDVSLSPMMGRYLSHFNNPLEIPSLNIHPDENYAREIMQLFTIGLYELNIDGSQVLDMNDQAIPTYDNDDIKEFAQVFTGLGPGEIMENPWVSDPIFGLDFYLTIKSEPMAMYEEWHDQSSKQLLNGYVIPAGQDGLNDIQDAVNHLFNHPNVGPFLALRLIQNMVKSNPSPGYIERVALAFNDNGNGVRGDMKAVIKAVLLDEEARSCVWLNEAYHGKLRAPIYRYYQLARANELESDDELYWNVGYDFLLLTEQAPLAASSVFNFYSPDFQPNGDIASADLVAPEFQIHNSRTSIGFMNSIYVNNNWALLWDWEGGTDDTRINFSVLEPIARDPEALLNHMDVVYTNGQLTEETRTIIKEALEGIQQNNFGNQYTTFRVRMALYLIMVSPDYAILK